MKIKGIALLLTLAVTLCLGGCAASTTADTPTATETDTAASTATPLTELTATVTVSNSEAINTFVMNVSSMTPCEYTNTRRVNGVDTTYTLRYDGNSMLQATVLTETADGTSEQTASLFLAPYYNFFPDATGMNLDAEAYLAALDELGLVKVFEEKSMQTLYGVYALGFADAFGQLQIVDFWLNEQEVAQIDFWEMMQSGGMVLQ